jgi:hypothetical protein
MARTQDKQRAAFSFLRARFQTQQPFTKLELQQASGWTTDTLDIYLSKQLGDLLEPVTSRTYRVAETFAAYNTWQKFRSIVSQKRRLVTEYGHTRFNAVVIYEFYMPLKHEVTLKNTLDSLFYRDAIKARLEAVGLPTLKREFHATKDEEDDDYLSRLLDFIGKTFTGYSIYHVNGRFRALDLRTLEDAAKGQAQGERYLVDETTAVARFIFPCDPHDSTSIAFLFEKLFIRSITKLVAGEDIIWMVESGMNNRVHVWAAKDVEGSGH